MLDEEEKEQVETQLANDAADGEVGSGAPITRSRLRR